MSGKTTLARDMAAIYARHGVNVLVLDPIADPRWPTEHRTSNQEDFLDWYWHSERCAAFMDEGGESVGRYNDAMARTATRGRHMGHVNHYIVQRVTQIAPLVRGQCTRIYLFCSSRKDGEILAEEWNRPELAECGKLARGEYIYAEKMGVLSSHKMGEKTDASSGSPSGTDNDGGRVRVTRPTSDSEQGGGEPSQGEAKEA